MQIYTGIMRYHFTKHAKDKFIGMRAFGFPITQKRIKEIIAHPARVESRPDGTNIAMVLYNKIHVIRVVYRTDGDIIIVITFYPGRRKAYEI